MNKKKISIILLIVFLITLTLTACNVFIDDSSTSENQTGNLTIGNEVIHYEKTGKCLDVIDGNTIQVYGIGKVQLIQTDTPQKGETGFEDAKRFVEDNCLGKTVYLDVDDLKPTDKYGRTLAIVYTDSKDINRELIDGNYAEISYFEPSEFKKGEV